MGAGGRGCILRGEPQISCGLVEAQEGKGSQEEYPSRSPGNLRVQMERK